MPVIDAKLVVTGEHRPATVRRRAVLGTSARKSPVEEPMNRSVWGPAQQEMSDLLRAHPDDVPAVVDQLTDLQDVLGRVPPLLRENPLCAFNAHYLTVTELVLERLYSGGFRDPAFLSRLEVEFAARYFDALRAWAGPEDSPHCPRAWAALFRLTTGPDLAADPLGLTTGPDRAADPLGLTTGPDRAADPLGLTTGPDRAQRPGLGRRTDLAGVRAGLAAHLAFDLPFALVTTFDQLGTDPIDDSDQHHDHLEVTRILALIAGPAAGPGDADDTGTMAWRDAQRLWRVRHDIRATEQEGARLDQFAGGRSERLLAGFGEHSR